MDLPYHFEDVWRWLSHVEPLHWIDNEAWNLRNFLWGPDWQGALNWGRKVEVKVAKRTCGTGFRPKNWGQFHPQGLENFRQACPSSKHECERYFVLVHKRFVVFIRVASSFLPHCLWRLVSRGFIPKNEVWIWQLIRTTLSSVCSRACAHVYALQDPSVCVYIYVYGYVS